jgi:hypothetical protein
MMKNGTNGLLFFERATQWSWAWLANKNGFLLILALLVVVFLLLRFLMPYVERKKGENRYNSRLVIKTMIRRQEEHSTSHTKQCQAMIPNKTRSWKKTHFPLIWRNEESLEVWKMFDD